MGKRQHITRWPEGAMEKSANGWFPGGIVRERRYVRVGKHAEFQSGIVRYTVAPL